MRIVYITTGYYPSLHGASTSLFNRLKWLSLWGHQVLVYAPDYSAFESIYPDYKSFVGEIMPGVNVIPYRSVPIFDIAAGIPGPVFSSFRNKKTIDQIIEFQPDVIQVEEPERLFVTGTLSRVGIRLGRRMRIPVVAFYHTDYVISIPNYKKHIAVFRLPGSRHFIAWLTSWVYNSYSTTMVQTRCVEKNLITNLKIKNTVQDQFLSVDKDIFNVNCNRQEIGLEIPENLVRILYVGRMFPDKHIDTLLGVFDAVKRKTNQCFFIFIGNGLEETKVIDWVTKNNNSIYLGHRPNKETVAFYQSSDIFVTASPNETFGLAILEAMACGLPAVGPDTGGVGELIRNGFNGFSIAQQNIEAYADALKRLVDDPELRKHFGKNAAEFTKDFSWKTATMNSIRVWKNCIHPVDKLLVTTHPDDELIFAGRALLKERGWKVVCITCGDNLERRQEFESVMKALKVNDFLIWNYPDQWGGDFDRVRLKEDLSLVLKENCFRKVVTHNPDGEYGHTQHRAVYELVASLVNENLFVFGKKRFPVSPVTLIRKLCILSLYKSQTRLLPDQNMDFHNSIIKFFLFEDIKKDQTKSIQTVAPDRESVFSKFVRSIAKKVFR
jgi:glycosyltransferase involved in cell wall biosynthesis